VRGSYASPPSSVELPLPARASPTFPPVHAFPPSGRLASLDPGRGEGALPPFYRTVPVPPSHRPTFVPPPAYSHARAGSSPVRTMQHPNPPGMQPREYPYQMAPYADRPPFHGGGGGGHHPSGFEHAGDHGDGKHKKRRGNLPKAVTDTLRMWFADHISHPYPSEEEKQDLMNQTGLTISQVRWPVLPPAGRAAELMERQISNWFINARRRSLPQITKQAQAEVELRSNRTNKRSAVT
jgi:hypothetical protein